MTRIDKTIKEKRKKEENYGSFIIILAIKLFIELL